LLEIGSAWAEAGDEDAGIAMLNSISNGSLRNSIMRQMASDRLREGDIEAALLWAGKMTDIGNQFFELLDIARKAIHQNSALARRALTFATDAADQERNDYMRASDFADIAVLAAEVLDDDQVRGVISAASEAAGLVGFPPTVMTKIAVARFKIGDTSAASRMMSNLSAQAVKEEDPRRQAASYHAIVKALIEMNDLDAATATALQIPDIGAKASPSSIRTDSFNMDGTRIGSQEIRDEALGEIAEAYVLKGDVEKAAVTMEKSSGKYIPADKLALIAWERVHADDFLTAKAVADAAMKFIERAGTGWRGADALWRISMAQASAGDLEAALSSARLIADPGDQRRAVALAAETYGETAEFTRLVEIADSTIKLLALAAFAREMAGKDRRKDAIVAIEVAIETLPFTDDEKSIKKALRQIANAQAELGDVTGVRDTISRIDSSQEQRDVTRNARDWGLAMVATADAQAGNSRSAIAVAERIAKERTKIQTLLAIARTLP
jgi:tetratricopeptide (TPR) repeat protein